MLGESFSMVLYGITLVPPKENIRAADPALLAPFYMDGTKFDGSAQQSAQLLILLLEQGSAWGYLLETSKLIFMCDSPAQ